MSSSALAAGIRQLRRKLAGQQPNEDNDEQLLHAFISLREDSAFAALVRRHGPMVLHVCRRVLGHEQDAEDAFQATFLVLAQSAASLRNKTSLASFLHGIAYRTAMKAKQSAARRRKYENSLGALTQPRSPANPADEMSWGEVRTLLDEEIERLPECYRSVFVLCCLEELSRAEAARRLGLNENTLSSRLAKARKLLAQRLARRGVELAALLATSTLAMPEASALSPLLVANTIRAALSEGSAGVVSASVAELVASGAAVAIVNKTKMAALLLVSVLALGGAGVWFGVQPQAVVEPPQSNAKAKAAKPKPPAFQEVNKSNVEVSGRVLYPDGKPVRGAKLVLAFHRIKKNVPNKIWATSTNEGRFQFTIHRMPEDESFWQTPDDPLYVLATAKGYGFAVARLDKPEAAANLTLQLVKDDVPIRGRILNLEGKPLAGVRVRISDLETFGRNLLYLPKRGDLTAWLAALKTGNRTLWELGRTYLTIVCIPCFDTFCPPVTTGADGRFEMRGIGRERIVELILEGPTIATQLVTVMTRSQETIRQRRDPAYPKGELAVYYGADCTILTEPTKPVVGVVRDRDTGKPLAGVRIVSNKIANPWNISNYNYGLLNTTTDKDGRYRLVGLPKGEGNELLATTDDMPYLPWSKKVENTPGLGPVTVDFALKRGISIKGRVTEKDTGKPLQGNIGYYCFRDNPHMKEIPYVHGSTEREIRKDGSFQLVAAPGHGLIGLYDTTHYLNGVCAEKIKGPRAELGGTERFATVPSWWPTDRAVVEINPKPGEQAITLDLIAVPYRTLKGTVLGPDGKPLAGAHQINRWTLPGSEFTVGGLPPGKLSKPRTIVFVHEGKKLAGFVTVRGDEKEPLQVRLQPWGAVTGRVVTAHEEPLSGLRVHYYARVAHHPGNDLPDKKGHFRIEGLTPGLKYELAVSKEGLQLRILGGDPKNLTVQPGEILDLGNLKVKVIE